MIVTTAQLDRLSQLAKQLDVADPVERYLDPVVGRWQELRDEANRWRAAAKAADEVAQRLSAPLGGLDAAWQGRDADSFLEYMRQIGLAGSGASDAMTAMADALDKTADGVRQIVRDMTDLLSDASDDASDAMAAPVVDLVRVRRYIAELEEPTSKLHETARDVWQAFTTLCRDIHDGRVGSRTAAHRMPTGGWRPSMAPGPAPKPASTQPKPSPTARPAPVPATPAAHLTSTATTTSAAQPGTVGTAARTPTAAQSSATQSAAGQSSAGQTTGWTQSSTQSSTQSQQPSGPPAMSGADPSAADPSTGGSAQPITAAGGGSGSSDGTTVGAIPMGAMGAMRGQGGDQQHKRKLRLSGNLADLLGEPDRTTPAVLGDRSWSTPETIGDPAGTMPAVIGELPIE